jgi:hypothetical protein
MAANSEIILIRLPQGMREWIKYNAQINNRSQSAEIRAVLQEAMQRNPLQVFVHHNQLYGKNYFTVSVGKDGRDEFETDDREQAVAVAKDKAEALGLRRGAIAFDIETDASVS